MKGQWICTRVVAPVLLAGLTSGAWAFHTGLPPVQLTGPVTYLSGGVGQDESQAIRAEIPRYALTLEFAGATSSGNEYLADVPVTIADAHGRTVLSTAARGPFMLVSLQPGRYTVRATHDGRTEQRKVDVMAGAHAREVFVWRMAS